MDEIKIENIEINNDSEIEKEKPEYHYVGVMFESKYGSTKENPKFYGNVYNYKTTKDLKEGQVIYAETKFGVSKVCIVDENVDPNTIEYDLDLIKEL